MTFTNHFDMLSYVREKSYCGPAFVKGSVYINSYYFVKGLQKGRHKVVLVNNREKLQDRFSIGGVAIGMCYYYSMKTVFEVDTIAIEMTGLMSQWIAVVEETL